MTAEDINERIERLLGLNLPAASYDVPCWDYLVGLVLDLAEEVQELKQALTGEEGGH